jgi:hypothetical protein
MGDKKKININIFIAIFLYGGERLKLTELIFKHYYNIKKKFENIANFKFTILGSEKDLSRNLTLKYFNEDEYFEFDQNKLEYGEYNIGYNNNFLKMLSDKIKMGIKLASRYNDDIIFWAGSNDYISSDFFKQVINYYNPDNRQIYGITNYLNGNNVNFYSKYDESNNNLNIHSNESFWWNGVHPKCRVKYKYIGCIIGLNYRLYSENIDIFEIWNYDEGNVEEYILNLQNIDFFSSKNIFSWNIKTSSNNDISSFKTLKKCYLQNNSIINIANITHKDKINDEFKYVEYMSKTL